MELVCSRSPILLLLAVLVVVPMAVAWACTCTNQTLCGPLQTSPPKKEVWAFAIGPADPNDPL
eukprot:SAG11_NODE_17329_length_521_cov_1.815166_1_plen_62_part_01